MKVGDIIINPFVEPNSIMSRSMVTHFDSKYTTTLRCDGGNSHYYTSDCKKWQVGGHIDLEKLIKGETDENN